MNFGSYPEFLTFLPKTFSRLFLRKFDKNFDTRFLREILVLSWRGLGEVRSGDKVEILCGDIL